MANIWIIKKCLSKNHGIYGHFECIFVKREAKSKNANICILTQEQLYQYMLREFVELSENSRKRNNSTFEGESWLGKLTKSNVGMTP